MFGISASEPPSPDLASPVGAALEIGRRGGVSRAPVFRRPQVLPQIVRVRRRGLTADEGFRDVPRGAGGRGRVLASRRHSLVQVLRHLPRDVR